jgi:release factor glutamine methyltransferase
MRGMPTVQDVLDEAEALLKASAAIEHPHAGKERFDAAELLEFVVGEDREPDAQVDSASIRRFRRLVSRRAGGVPTSYLTGWAEFAGMRLIVGPGAFIPRESSEFMAQQAVRRLRRRPRPVHVDLATGVGPVALAVAAALPHAVVFGADLFPRPVAYARRNAARLQLSNARFVRGDLFGGLPGSVRGSVDTVSIHPPYVARREIRELPSEIREFEPRASLTDDSRDGMGLLARTVRDAPEWLRPSGWLLVEVSPDRSRQVATVLRRGGFRDVRSTKGDVEVSRVVLGRTR